MSVTRSPTARPVVDPLGFVASDVTGLRRRQFEAVDGHRSAADVAQSVAMSLDLPSNVKWSLRNEQSARMLREDQSVGSQVESGAELVVIPKSQLG